MPRGIGLTRMSSNSLLLERMASDLSEGHVDDDEAFLVLTHWLCRRRRRRCPGNDAVGSHNAGMNSSRA